MNLQDFKKIFTEHGGCVTPDQIEKLAEFAPDLTLGVKVGYGPRFTTTAKNFKLDLENNAKYHLDIHNVDQYVRDPPPPPPPPGGGGGGGGGGR